MALSGVIDSFATGTYAVTRTVVSTYGTDGRLVAGATSVVNITASIQPLSGRDLKALPEGRHGEDVRKMYAKVELLTQTPGNDPDLVTYKGETWEVFNVDSWEAFGLGTGGNHYKALIARLDTP